MKKLLSSAIALLFLINTASAQVTGQDIANTCGLAQPCSALISSIGTGGGVIPNNTWLRWRNAANTTNVDILQLDNGDNTILNAATGGSVFLRAANDANRYFEFGSASDAALFLAYGDDGITAGQVFDVRATTADAADNGTVSVTGGGAVGSSRGAYVQVYGNESGVGPGIADLVAGNVAGGKIRLYTFGAQPVEISTNNLLRFSVSTAGDLVSDATSGGNIVMSKAGATLALQEGTAGAACSGTVTGTGTTAVTVATTCAKTGARIFISRNSAPSGTAQCWTDTIVNNVSFNLDCDAAETGSFNWVIFQEAA
jgi:hypothetical protein